MVAAERDQLPDEREEVRVGMLPVEPGHFVVLAVAVVVAALRAPDLVAAEEHRHALGEEQRRQEVALLSDRDRP